MTLVGIGVLLIGIAFLVLAVYLSWTLNNLAHVLRGVEKTVEHLPNQLNDIFKETGNLINHTNSTLSDVNEKLRTLSPLFYIVEDVGEMSRKLTTPLANFNISRKKKTEEKN
ncbi:DUF948 domain-containing protein [Virgibacillus sp. JSM 102003]|uniref:DUF948 domain-containing protein n=1 Tax=Virgibacillus sp. JSM 102003 TaxID=1562108 RepID=UPI0035BF20D0